MPDTLLTAIGLWESVLPRRPAPILEWMSDHIQIENARGQRIPIDTTLTPYLVSVYRAWEDSRIHRITCVAPDKTGKSCTWLYPLLWRVCTSSGVRALIAYENAEKGARINRDDLVPLMEGIPELREALSAPWSSTADSYHVMGSIIYWVGAGAPVTSYRMSVAVADEVDQWVTANATKAHEAKQRSNLRHLDKRLRNAARPLRIAVCTPTVESGPIWQEYQSSNQGYWHLRCLHCGELTPSHQVDGSYLPGEGPQSDHLQWATTDGGHVIEDSIRWICPHCRAEHTEEDALALTQGGEYVFTSPDIETHAGFQWGALAVPAKALGWEGLRWGEIARICQEGGSRGTRDAQLDKDNGIRGLPLRQRKTDSHREQIVLSHRAAYPDDLALAYTLFAADTQGDRHVWRVRGYDVAGNSYGLACGESGSIGELLDLMQAPYRGIPPAYCIIDVAGNRQPEMIALLDRLPNLFGYRGASIQEAFRQGNEHPKVILAPARRYAADLLYLMYEQLDRERPYWYLENLVPMEYVTQLLDVQANKRVKNGHLYEHWESVAGNDHWFDAEKMLLVLLKVFSKSLQSRVPTAEPEKKSPKIERGGNFISGALPATFR